VIHIHPYNGISLSHETTKLLFAAT
jgi:hypothetical protein